MPESISASAAMLPDRKINDRIDMRMAFIILCVQFVVLDFYEQQCQGRREACCTRSLIPDPIPDLGLSNRNCRFKSCVD